MNEKIQIIIDDTKIPLDTNCKHELKPCGNWDGTDKEGNWIAGTIYRCSKCKGITRNKKDGE